MSNIVDLYFDDLSSDQLRNEVLEILSQKIGLPSSDIGDIFDRGYDDSKIYASLIKAGAKDLDYEYERVNATMMKEIPTEYVNVYVYGRDNKLYTEGVVDTFTDKDTGQRLGNVTNLDLLDLNRNRSTYTTDLYTYTTEYSTFSNEISSENIDDINAKIYTELEVDDLLFPFGVSYVPLRLSLDNDGNPWSGTTFAFGTLNTMARVKQTYFPRADFFRLTEELVEYLNYIVVNPPFDPVKGIDENLKTLIEDKIDEYIPRFNSVTFLILYPKGQAYKDKEAKDIIFLSPDPVDNNHMRRVVLSGFVVGKDENSFGFMDEAFNLVVPKPAMISSKKIPIPESWIDKIKKGIMTRLIQQISGTPDGYIHDGTLRGIEAIISDIEKQLRIYTETGKEYAGTNPLLVPLALPELYTTIVDRIVIAFISGQFISVGSLAASAISEPLQQGSLSMKHASGRFSRVSDSIRGIEGILHLTKLNKGRDDCINCIRMLDPVDENGVAHPFNKLDLIERSKKLTSTYIRDVKYSYKIQDEVLDGQTLFELDLCFYLTNALGHIDPFYYNSSYAILKLDSIKLYALGITQEDVISSIEKQKLLKDTLQGTKLEIYYTSMRHDICTFVIHGHFPEKDAEAIYLYDVYNLVNTTLISEEYGINETAVDNDVILASLIGYNETKGKTSTAINIILPSEDSEYQSVTLSTFRSKELNITAETIENLDLPIVPNSIVLDDNHNLYVKSFSLNSNTDQMREIRKKNKSADDRIVDAITQYQNATLDLEEGNVENQNIILELTFHLMNALREIEDEKAKYNKYNLYTVPNKTYNFEELLYSEGVDKYRSYTTSYYDLLKFFGIEATRNFILTELYDLCSNHKVDVRHLELMVDYMTHKGPQHGMTPLSYVVIAKKGGSVLSAIGNRDPVKLITKAAGQEVQERVGISAASAIMTNKPIPFGYGQAEEYQLSEIRKRKKILSTEYNAADAELRDKAVEKSSMKAARAKHYYDNKILLNEPVQQLITDVEEDEEDFFNSDTGVTGTNNSIVKVKRPEAGTMMDKPQIPELQVKPSKPIARFDFSKLKSIKITSAQI